MVFRGFVRRFLLGVLWKNQKKLNDFAHKGPGKIPQTSPKHHKERNSETETVGEGIFQGYVEILEKTCCKFEPSGKTTGSCISQWLENQWLEDVFPISFWGTFVSFRGSRPDRTSLVQMTPLPTRLFLRTLGMQMAEVFLT